jgi:hypothetical protein
MLLKATSGDFLGRFREVISDPLNLLIERVPMAGFLDGDQVYLHNGLRVPVAGPGAYYGPFSQLLSSTAVSMNRCKSSYFRKCSNDCRINHQ